MKMSIKKLVGLATIFQFLMIIILAGCTPMIQTPVSTLAPVVTKVTPTQVCHATGDSANPFKELTVNSTELAVHVGHAGDIIPAPVSGCPTGKVVINDGKIIVCHATADTAKPYEEIEINLNGLDGHGDHENDIFPATKGGCPTALIATNTGNGKIIICHATGSKNNPYNLITVSVNGLNGHNNHAGDIIPAPANGCPVGAKK
jgi:hypothetical protein